MEIRQTDTRPTENQPIYQPPVLALLSKIPCYGTIAMTGSLTSSRTVADLHIWGLQTHYSLVRSSLHSAKYS